ncbi:hypothetical protein DFH06DRAFT_1418654 [Mycena polygramma]|nr:hypothetical protein DFH06DRAFT_1418654 [Mycena polygramma]
MRHHIALLTASASAQARKLYRAHDLRRLRRRRPPAQRTAPAQTPRASRPSRTPPKCFRCGVVGHTLKECSEPPKCFGCGETGHIRRDCTTNPPKPRSAPTPAPAPAAEAAPAPAAA